MDLKSLPAGRDYEENKELLYAITIFAESIKLNN